MTLGTPGLPNPALILHDSHPLWRQPPADIRESVQQLKYYRSSIFKRWGGMNEPRRR